MSNEIDDPYSLARNPNTPSHILHSIAHDEYYITRECVALNPNTRFATLELLSNDNSWFVRRAVASNINVTAEIVENIYIQDHFWNFDPILRNPSAPTYMQLFLYYEYSSY